MRKWDGFKGFLAMATVGLLAASGKAAHAEHTRVTNPNFLGVEAFGRGLLYSIQYDRAVNDDLVAGFGYGSVGVEPGSSTSIVPVYINYYFAREQGSFYATAGVSFATNRSSSASTSSIGGLEFSSSPLIPVIGAGFEERGDSGFLFRATVYGLLGKSYTPWFGLGFGYCF